MQAPALVAEFFFHRYGLASLRDWHITELVASLRHHRDETVGRQLESGEGTKDGVCPAPHCACRCTGAET